MALPLQGKGPCLKQPLLALILLSLLSLLNQSAATVLVSPLAFVNPQIQLPRLERALLSGTVTSAASPTSARLLQSTHPRMPGRSQRGEAIGLRALVESGPALPPSHTAFTAVSHHCTRAALRTSPVTLELRWNMFILAYCRLSRSKKCRIPRSY